MTREEAESLFSYIADNDGLNYQFEMFVTVRLLWVTRCQLNEICGRYPGLAFTLIGGGVALAFMFGPIQLTDSVRLGTTTFLAACLTAIVGTQLLTFGALARMIAAKNGLVPVGGASRVLRNWATTDNIALLAFWLLLLGLFLFLIAFAQLARIGFGDLHTPLTTKLTAAGFSLIAISIQSAFAAFLFGIIEIPVRQEKEESALQL
ncbi:hypothetical protein [Ruegeria profundi]|uniref:hypothetical protein n=1 Tax=Ruegeria profundi TaxID=1685378 RepID=UPI001CD37501|nr:hypothetical protein [Ruegeria profundi]MCA0927075.1 hypothetical protein [Ruegeria profundi]